VLRVARLCDQFGWFETARFFFEPFRDQLPPEASSVYIKALFHERRFAEFRERWARAENRSSDPGLRLYERAHAMGWGTGPEAQDAERELESASEDPALGPRAARLYMMAAGQKGNVNGYEWGLERLKTLNETTVEDHVALWFLLTEADQKEEAIGLAENFTTAPQTVAEMMRLAEAYYRLGLTELCREILSRFVPVFSGSPEAWLYYASFLENAKDWPALRNVAMMIRDEGTLSGKLWGFSYFLEGLAVHRQGVHSGAAAAFEKAAEATYEAPGLAYRVAKDLTGLKYGAQALRILRGIEETFGSNREFWETYFEAAHGAKDPEAVLVSAEQSYKLAPRDLQIHNRYAAALMLNRKDPEESIKLTLQLVNAYPHSVAAKINHSFALLLNRREEEARKLLETLSYRALPPLEANAYHLGLFEVYFNLGLWDQARAEAEKVNTSALFPNQVELFEEKRNALPERVASQY
jgi:hypothetical protein